MKHDDNEIMLSAYLDGELDAGKMFEADMLLEKDDAARRYVLDAVRTTAFLRADTNKVVHEELPQRLLESLGERQTAKPRPKPVLPHLLRVAAVLILGLLGFGGGMLLERFNESHLPAVITPLPSMYSDVVDKALEYNLSGTPQKWQAPGSAVAVTVTPVKTYRDKNGVYYREYRLEIASNNERSRINGLAYRTLKGHWKTKALFFPNSAKST